MTDYEIECTRNEQTKRKRANGNAITMNKTSLPGRRYKYPTSGRELVRQTPKNLPVYKTNLVNMLKLLDHYLRNNSLKLWM